MLSLDYGLSGCRVKVRQGNSMLLRSFLLSPGMKFESHSNRAGEGKRSLIRLRSKLSFSLDHSWCTNLLEISSNSIEARRIQIQIEIERIRISFVKSESNQLWTTHVTVLAVPLWAVHSAGQCLILCPEWFLGVSVNLRPLKFLTLRTGLFLIIFAGLTLIVERWKGKSFLDHYLGRGRKPLLRNARLSLVNLSEPF